jgi:prevent-host-death family protein
MFANVHAANTHLSRLVDRAAAGEDVIIGKAGRPLVRLVPYAPDKTPRQPGRWAGRLTVADDFDATPDWVLDAFEGS